MEKFTIRERLLLLPILPHEGSITDLRIIRELREALTFSEAEHAELGIQHEDNGIVRWNPEKNDATKDIEVGSVARKVIAKALKRASDQEALSEAHIPLYERFVGDA
jgi:hypothetical protein